MASFYTEEDLYPPLSLKSVVDFENEKDRDRMIPINDYDIK